MRITYALSYIYGGIFRTYIVLLFISCARLFYFVDRFFFSIISCARLFYFVDRFFFSIISCARLFFISYVVFSFLLSRAHDFFLFCNTIEIKVRLQIQKSLFQFTKVQYFALCIYFLFQSFIPLHTDNNLGGGESHDVFTPRGVIQF